MQRRERAFRTVSAVVVICAVVGVLSWGLGRSAAQEQGEVGRYQVAVPDLVLDTATGRLVTGNGQVLEQAIDPNGTEAGRYSVDGYVAAVTRAVGLDVMNQPVAYTQVVKGYVLGDTKTGAVVRERIYHSQPLQLGDLQAR